MNLTKTVFKLKGVTYGNCQDNIRKLISQEITHCINLVREPNNKSDNQAISVRYQNQHLGYVPKEIASQWGPLMDLGAEIHAKVMQLNVHDYYNTVGVTVELIPGDNVGQVLELYNKIIKNVHEQGMCV
jgi:hypothetical protein